MYFKYSIFIAYLLDLIFADPYNMPHPVKIIGKLISFLEDIFLKTHISKFISGIFTAVITISISYIATYYLINLSYGVNFYLGAVFECVLAYTVFASKCLEKEAIKIYEEIKKNDLNSSRIKLSYIVGRDTEKLSFSDIIRAKKLALIMFHLITKKVVIILMTKTIFVPDLHLKAQLILPIFEELIQSRDIKNVVFMGDYTDAHGEQDNLVLYVNDLLYLTNFVEKLKENGHDVTMLLGNHDVHYLSEIPSPDYTYSKDTLGFLNIQGLLYDLQLQPTHLVGKNILVSHAGYNRDFMPEETLFEVLTPSHPHPELKLWTVAVGQLRGGLLPVGNFLWSDKEEMINYPNLFCKKQVVGHTPVDTVSRHKDIWFTDTFSVVPEVNGFKFLGDGSVLIYDDETEDFEVVQTNWATPEMKYKLKNYFKKNG